MYWYRFELTDWQIREGGLARMERQFEEYIACPKERESACLLRKWQPYDDDAVFYIYTVTPLGKETLSRLFAAQPCDPPSLSSTRFWSGAVSLNESLMRSETN